MTNDYVVTYYNLRGRNPVENERREVVAMTAEEAVDMVLDAPSYASRTKRWAHHPSEAVRDNAHYQIDWGGLCGASAIRAEIAGREAEVEIENRKFQAAAVKVGGALERAGYVDLGSTRLPHPYSTDAKTGK